MWLAHNSFYNFFKKKNTSNHIISYSLSAISIFQAAITRLGLNFALILEQIGAIAFKQPVCVISHHCENILWWCYFLANWGLSKLCSPFAFLRTLAKLFLDVLETLYVALPGCFLLCRLDHVFDQSPLLKKFYSAATPFMFFDLLGFPPGPVLSNCEWARSIRWVGLQFLLQSGSICLRSRLGQKKLWLLCHQLSLMCFASFRYFGSFVVAVLQQELLLLFLISFLSLLPLRRPSSLSHGRHVVADERFILICSL